MAAMRWVRKGLAHRGVSALPRRESVNYLLQRYLTRSLPVSDAVLRHHVEEAEAHFGEMERHLDTPAREAHVYEFGAGWDLIGPLTMAGLGVRRQLLVDVRRNLRYDLVEQAVRRLARLRPDLALPAETDEPAARILERLGIRYLAPRDARATGLPAGSVDVALSTFTLEHIPERDILRILRESRRLLRPGGLVSCTVDMKDHYAYFDGSLHPFHFLTVPEPLWWVVNPPLHYQNRLRLPEYERLFAAAGLRVIDRFVKWPTDAEREQLERLPLARRFRRTGYSLAELGAKQVRLVATAA
jgi:SAM-dependent methyltransferase